MLAAFHTYPLCRRAARYIRSSQPIPLDLYASLNEAGVDITEFERTERNKIASGETE